MRTKWRKPAKELGISFIHVTHGRTRRLRWADEIVVMNVRHSKGWPSARVFTRPRPVSRAIQADINVIALAPSHFRPIRPRRRRHYPPPPQAAANGRPRHRHRISRHLRQVHVPHRRRSESRPCPKMLPISTPRHQPRRPHRSDLDAKTFTN